MLLEDALQASLRSFVTLPEDTDDRPQILPTIRGEIPLSVAARMGCRLVTVRGATRHENGFGTGPLGDNRRNVDWSLNRLTSLNGRFWQSHEALAERLPVSTCAFT